MFIHVYVLLSEKDNDFYVGKAEDLNARLELHAKGRVPSTRDRRPFRFVYAEICRSNIDATRREKYLKTSWGKRYIRNRIKNDLSFNKVTPKR